LTNILTEFQNFLYDAKIFAEHNPYNIQNIH